MSYERSSNRLTRYWTRLSRRFDGIYAKGVGRPSVPPEQLLRALLLQVLYTIRSERQLIEQIDYNLLYRWFVGLELDDEVFSATVFTKNRERLLKARSLSISSRRCWRRRSRRGWCHRSTSRWTGR